MLNPGESQVTEISVETDYDIDFSTNRNAPAVVFSPNVDYNTYLDVKVTKTASNIVYPKQLRLAIYGCGNAVNQLLTKGQIEDCLYFRQYHTDRSLMSYFSYDNYYNINCS